MLMGIVRTLGALALASVVLTSCSARQKGGLMLAITSDLVAGKDLDGVTVEVRLNGELVSSKRFTIGEPATKLPLTVSVVEGANAAQRVQLRAIGYKGGQPRIAREASAVIPHGETQLVRLPLDWLADGSATPGGCPDGQSNVAGSCASADVVNLPVYMDGDVFGGGSSKGEGACLDVAACFSGAAPIAPDNDCTVALPSGSAGLNVGLVVASRSDGVCTEGACVVPLAEGPEGFRALGSGRVALPAAACGAARVAGVLVVGTCETRTVAIPPCGVATVVNGRAIRPPQLATDAGALDAAEAGDASVDATSDADAGVVIPYGDGGVSVSGPTDVLPSQGSAVMSLWDSANELRFGLATGEIKSFHRTQLSYATLRAASGTGWKLWARDGALVARGQETGNIDLFDFGSGPSREMLIMRAGASLNALAVSDEVPNPSVLWSESRNGDSLVYRCMTGGTATCPTPELLASFKGVARSMAPFHWDVYGVAIGTTDGRFLSCVGKCNTPDVVYSNGTGEQILSMKGASDNIVWVVDRGAGKLRRAARMTGSWSITDHGSTASLGSTDWPETIVSTPELFYLATTGGVFATEKSTTLPWSFTRIGSLTTATAARATFDELLLGTSDGRVVRYGIGN
jgi:hypothetical protein